MLDLFKVGNYTLIGFDTHHITALLMSTIISLILLLMPIFFKSKKTYGIFLGYFVVLTKILDILYRIYYEKFPIYEALPFHLCNFAIIVSGISLILGSKKLYNVVYHYSYAAIIVLFIPGSFNYSTLFYIFLFMFTHMIEIVVILYGRIYLNYKINRDGYILSIILFILLVINASFVNYRLGTNFMYVTDYILPAFKFMPFNIYLIIFLSLHILSQTVMYKLRKLFYK